MKDKVSERQPTNAKMLEQAIEEAWVREMTTEYSRSLVESTSIRLKANQGHGVVLQNIEFLVKFDINVCYISSQNVCLQRVLVFLYIFTSHQL